MKLSITQTLLGILIIITACFIMAWMIFWTVPSQPTHLPSVAGPERSVEAYPKYQTTYNIARYASGALLVLGIAVVIISVRQAAKTKHPAVLASVQLSAGLLVAVAAAFITARGYPLEFVTPLQEDNLVGMVNINPGPGMAVIMLLTTLTVLFGLAVSGIGIAQLVKSKKSPAV